MLNNFGRIWLSVNRWDMSNNTFILVIQHSIGEMNFIFSDMNLGRLCVFPERLFLRIFICATITFTTYDNFSEQS